MADNSATLDENLPRQHNRNQVKQDLDHPQEQHAAIKIRLRIIKYPHHLGALLPKKNLPNEYALITWILIEFMS